MFNDKYGDDSNEYRKQFTYGNDSNEYRKQFTKNVEKRIRHEKHISVFSRWFVTLLFGAIALVPLWFWLFIKNQLNPETFWEKFAVYGAGLFFLGGLQFMCIFVYLGLLINVIWKD